jgi:hypothetical protein
LDVHAPPQITTRPAEYVPLPVTTRTPPASGVMSITGSWPWISAPASIASLANTPIPFSESTNPASGSHTPT